jgi:hypothetical protein
VHFFQLTDAVDNQQVSLKELWKSYNLMNAITNTEEAWKKVSQHRFNAIWKKA